MVTAAAGRFAIAIRVRSRTEVNPFDASLLGALEPRRVGAIRDDYANRRIEGAGGDTDVVAPGALPEKRRSAPCAEAAPRLGR